MDELVDEETKTIRRAAFGELIAVYWLDEPRIVALRRYLDRRGVALTGHPYL